MDKHQTKAYGSFFLTQEKEQVFSILDENFDWKRMIRHLNTFLSNKEIFFNLDLLHFLINVSRLQNIDLSSASLPNLNCLFDTKEIDENLLLESLKIAKDELLSFVPPIKKEIFVELLVEFQNLYLQNQKP